MQISALNTIYALASGSGRSAIAIIRVSGPKTWRVLETIATVKRENIRPRMLTLRTLINPQDHTVLDKAMVAWMPAPKSYTGEDCCEFHTHGGVAVVKAVERALSSIPGVRRAQPGEFTQRAFFAGKMSLVGVEALADLISAETEYQRQQALCAMNGPFEKRCDVMTRRLTQILAHVEAWIEFGESEAIESDTVREALKNISLFRSELKTFLSAPQKAERIRNGINVGIVGAPNVGKSSVLNALCEQKVAITSSQAGTTRDLIRVTCDIGGYPIAFCDSAGLRDDSKDEIEKIGIDLALRYASDEAQINLIVLDASKLEPETICEEISRIERMISNAEFRKIYVLNKRDLINDIKAEALLRSLENGNIERNDCCVISCVTSGSVAKIREMLISRLSSDFNVSKEEEILLTRSRYRTHLERCDHLLKQAESMFSSDAAMGAEFIKRALTELGYITGKVTTEDVLDVVFRDFCIGK